MKLHFSQKGPSVSRVTSNPALTSKPLLWTSLNNQGQSLLSSSLPIQSIRWINNVVNKARSSTTIRCSILNQICVSSWVWLGFSTLGDENIHSSLAEWAYWNPCSFVTEHVSTGEVVNLGTSTGLSKEEVSHVSSLYFCIGSYGPSYITVVLPKILHQWFFICAYKSLQELTICSAERWN